MYSMNFTIMYLQRSWTSNISLSDHSLLSLRLLQLCPKHSLARDGLMKQAQRKGKETAETIQLLERENPIEMLGHIENFTQTCLGKHKTTTQFQNQLLLD